MLGTTGRLWRKSWTVISAALAWAAIAGLTGACQRKSPTPPASPTPTKSLPPPDAQPPAQQQIDVLVWIETTPPGARIVRVSDGFVLGWTPEIVEFVRSTEPALVRFEMEGFAPVTREVSVTTDGELAVVLRAIPKKRALATKRSKRE